MLLEHLRKSGPRQVLVRTRQAAVGDLLRAILREWHYLTEPVPNGRRVALVEQAYVPTGIAGDDPVLRWFDTVADPWAEPAPES